MRDRTIEARGLEELSLGDFVLSGGEIAAMTVIDACVRLLPGVVGDAASLEEESFAAGLLPLGGRLPPGRKAPPPWEPGAFPPGPAAAAPY